MPDRIRLFQLGAIVLMLAGLTTLLIGCDSITGPEPPDRSAFEAGTIGGVNITNYPDDLGVVSTVPNLWIERPNQSCGTLVNYELDPELLFRSPGKRHFRISQSDVMVGMEVEVWIRPGTLVESVCPGYLAATHIVVSAPR